MARRILVTLAADTTDTECGSCLIATSSGNDYVCPAFGLGSVGREGRRLAECIAAEQRERT